MNYTFADRMQGMESSAIRELLKVAQDPEVIAFSAGNPAPESFPIKEMADISASIFQEQGAKALQYGISEGYPELRRLSEERLKKRNGIGREIDQLILIPKIFLSYEATTIMSL